MPACAPGLGGGRGKKLETNSLTGTTHAASTLGVYIAAAAARLDVAAASRGVVALLLGVPTEGRHSWRGSVGV